MASPFQSPVHTHPCELPLCQRSVDNGLPPNIDLHDLVERDAVLAPTVEQSCSIKRFLQECCHAVMRYQHWNVLQDADVGPNTSGGHARPSQQMFTPGEAAGG